MSKKGCGRKKKSHGRRKKSGIKEKNPYIVIFSKQKEWREVEVELFCQILNGRQGEGNTEDEARERVDL